MKSQNKISSKRVSCGFFAVIVWSAFFSIVNGAAANGQSKPVTVRVSISNDSINPLQATIIVTIKTLPTVHIYAPPNQFFLFTHSGLSGVTESTAVLPPVIPYTNADGTVDAVISGTVEIRRKLTISPKQTDSWYYKGFFKYQACDVGLCYAPEQVDFSFGPENLPHKADIRINVTEPLPKDEQSRDTEGRDTDKIGENVSKDSARQNFSENRLDTISQSFDIRARAYGFVNVADFTAFLDRYEEQNVSFADKSILLIILIVFFGGLALNLTPCVLPMVPINLAIISAGTNASSRKSGFRNGLLFGSALAGTYGILGLAVILSGAVFGKINALPAFNFAVSGVFVFLALAMSGIFSLDFSRFTPKALRSGPRGHIPGILLMGVLSAVLAGACVAPVVIAVLLFSAAKYNEGIYSALLLPFLLGAGMALPWPFAGAGISVLPRPGKWMTKVKYIFSGIILVLAFYYAYTGISLLEYRSETTLPPLSENTNAPLHEQTIYTDIAEGLYAAQKQQKPVFLDFWATWCKNCLAMESQTFRDPSVAKLFSEFIIIKYQAENPDDPDIARILSRFDVRGLPTYVILTPR